MAQTSTHLLAQSSVSQKFKHTMLDFMLTVPQEWNQGVVQEGLSFRGSGKEYASKFILNVGRILLFAMRLQFLFPQWLLSRSHVSASKGCFWSSHMVPPFSNLQIFLMLWIFLTFSSVFFICNHPGKPLYF